MVSYDRSVIVGGPKDPPTSPPATGLTYLEVQDNLERLKLTQAVSALDRLAEEASPRGNGAISSSWGSSWRKRWRANIESCGN